MRKTGYEGGESFPDQPLIACVCYSSTTVVPGCQPPGGRGVTVTVVVFVVVLVVVLVTVLVVVDGSTDLVVGSAEVVGGADTVLVSVIVTVLVSGAAVLGVVVTAVGEIGFSVVVVVLPASPDPMTDHTISASRSVTNTPAANIAAGVRYQGTGSLGGRPGGWRSPPYPAG